jgi:hypothetical protein
MPPLYTKVRTIHDEQYEHELFDMFDADSNKTISASELHALLEMLAPRKYSRAEVDAMMLEADADGDGCIDFDEFKAVVGARSHDLNLGPIAMQLQSHGNGHFNRQEHASSAPSAAPTSAPLPSLSSVSSSGLSRSGSGGGQATPGSSRFVIPELTMSTRCAQLSALLASDGMVRIALGQSQLPAAATATAATAAATTTTAASGEGGTQAPSVAPLAMSSAPKVSFAGASMKVVRDALGVPELVVAPAALSSSSSGGGGGGDGGGDGGGGGAKRKRRGRSIDGEAPRPKGRPLKAPDRWRTENAANSDDAWAQLPKFEQQMIQV